MVPFQPGVAFGLEMDRAAHGPYMVRGTSGPLPARAKGGNS